MAPEDLDRLVLLVAFRLGMLDLRGPRGRQGARGLPGEPGQPGGRGRNGAAGLPGRDGAAGEAGPRGEPGLKGDTGDSGDLGQATRAPDFSVNAARVDYGYSDGSVVMRTGHSVNEPGAFTGTGKGNKAILGAFGFDGVPFGALQAISYSWTRIAGPGGPFYVPPGGPSVQTPYCNLIVDFGPPTGVRILVVLDDSLAGAITGAIGSYSNASNTLTYGWTASKAVLIVGQPPPAPGGVAPLVTVGAAWQENAYDATALFNANPAMRIVDAYTGDNGMPSGARLPGIVLCSGDSNNTTEAGYRIASLTINAHQIIP